MSVEITDGSKVCEKVWASTRNGAWCCMLDEGHTSESCLLVQRGDREDRRRDVLRDREIAALRAENALLLAGSA